jgi:outer membrane protein assembly factor BamB
MHVGHFISMENGISTMKPRVGLIRPFIAILFACLLLAACSGSGESTRLKRQADQSMAEGRLPEAVLTYRQALNSHPNDLDLLRGLGLALAAQGRSRSAAAVLNKAAALKPEDASIKSALVKLVTRPQDGLSLKLAWFSNGRDSEPLGAAVSAGKIFVAYADGRLLALNQSSGQGVWDIKAPEALVSAPAADAGQVWVGSENGAVLVINGGSGLSLGSYRTGGAVYAAPALSADKAFCASNDGWLYALERTTLKLDWKAQIGEALHVSPVVSGQTVYVGSNDGRLYGFNVSSGQRIWPYGIPTQGAIESVPSLSNGRIFFGSGDGRIYALDAETGGQYWHFSTPDAVYARPLVLNDQVIVASSGMLLASIGYSDGSPSWSLPFQHPITEAPVFFKDRLYLVTRGDPRLFAVESLTGNLVGEMDTGDWIAQGPLEAGSDLILIGKDGAVFLYR